jgi:MFS family permease
MPLPSSEYQPPPFQYTLRVAFLLITIFASILAIVAPYLREWAWHDWLAVAVLLSVVLLMVALKITRIFFARRKIKMTLGKLFYAGRGTTKFFKPKRFTVFVTLIGMTLLIYALTTHVRPFTPPKTFLDPIALKQFRLACFVGMTVSCAMSTLAEGFNLSRPWLQFRERGLGVGYSTVEWRDVSAVGWETQITGARLLRGTVHLKRPFMLKTLKSDFTIPIPQTYVPTLEALFRENLTVNHSLPETT